MVKYLWENILRKKEQEKDIATILGENYLFEDLTKKELRFVKEIVHVRSFRPSEIIFRQGELGVGMYIVISGIVDIVVENIHAKDKSKKDIFITRLQAGDFFGEISLVEDNGRRTATATAYDEVTLIGFFKPDLTEIVERRPSTGVKILWRLAEVLGRRLKETADKVSELKREFRELDE